MSHVSAPLSRERAGEGPRPKGSPVFKFQTLLNKSEHKDLGGSMTALSRHI